MAQKSPKKLTLSSETLQRLVGPDLGHVVGGMEKRPWLTAWTCRTCPDVSCGCPA